jgi:hypothetical protein
MSELQPSTDSIRPSSEGAVRRVLEAAREQATLVDLEAAFAWVSEGRLADELLADWRRLGEEVKAELARCQKTVRTLKAGADSGGVTGSGLDTEAEQLADHPSVAARGLDLVQDAVGAQQAAGEGLLAVEPGGTGGW